MSEHAMGRDLGCHTPPSTSPKQFESAETAPPNQPESVSRKTERQVQSEEFRPETEAQSPVCETSCEPVSDSAHSPLTNTQRDDRGRLMPGNTLPATHGLYSDRDLANLQAEVAAFLAQSVTDDGGVDELSRRRQSLHEYRARVHRRIKQLDSAIEARGLFDNRGKLRVSWLSKLETLIATARAIDNLLGLDRRAKPVHTFEQVMRGDQ